MLGSNRQIVDKQGLIQATDAPTDIAALRAQGTAHLRDSSQPRVNTAEAVRVMIEPAVRAIGVQQPGFVFDLAPGLRMQDR